jgi:hypothetical protein
MTQLVPEPPWAAYKLPPVIPRFEAVLQEYVFSTVWHVCHLEDAIRIIEDGIVRPRLVEDDSRLRDTRVAVAWFSANHWPIGYRYGNIRFDIQWPPLMQANALYWLEDANYQIPAYRLLVARDVGPQLLLPAIAGGTLSLVRYPFDEQGGPVYRDPRSGVWYRNNQGCTSEFLLPGDLPLSSVSGISFVKHSERYCSRYRMAPGTCRHLASSGGQVGTRLIAALAARYPTAGNWQTAGGLIAPADCSGAWAVMMSRLGMTHALPMFGEPPPRLLTLAKAVLLAWAAEQDEVAYNLRECEPVPENLGNAMNWLLDQAFPQVRPWVQMVGFPANA